MKTLVNKDNPQLRITAPEIGTGTHGYYYVGNVGYHKDHWTLVEGIKGNLEEIPSKEAMEEAAEDFVWEVMENDEDGISELSRKLRPSSKISDYYDALAEFFKAGAKWMMEQMKRDSK